MCWNQGRALQEKFSTTAMWSPTAQCRPSSAGTAAAWSAGSAGRSARRPGGMTCEVVKCPLLHGEGPERSQLSAFQIWELTYYLFICQIHKNSIQYEILSGCYCWLGTDLVYLSSQIGYGRWAYWPFPSWCHRNFKSVESGGGSNQNDSSNQWFNQWFYSNLQ